MVGVNEDGGRDAFRRAVTLVLSHRKETAKLYGLYNKSDKVLTGLILHF